MDNEEVEFIAENELVTIIPNFQYKKLYLIGVGKILFIKRIKKRLVKNEKCFCFLVFH